MGEELHFLRVCVMHGNVALVENPCITRPSRVFRWGKNIGKLGREESGGREKRRGWFGKSEGERQGKQLG